MFWLAVDVETLALGDTKHSNDTEQTWKGRLVWTIRTNALQTAPHKHISGDKLWKLGRLRVLTSAPPTQSCRSRIMFEPCLDESEVGDVTMLVLDFVGTSLWQYSCIKKAARQPMTGPLLHFCNGQANPASATVAMSSRTPCQQTLTFWGPPGTTPRPRRRAAPKHPGYQRV